MAKVTQKSLAESLGLSHSTVSLALRGDERISESTRLRIREAAQRMGYRPHLAGRALVSQRTHAIGLMMGGAHLSPFSFVSAYAVALQTFSRTIQERDCHLLVSADATDSEMEEGSLIASPMLTTRMVDGLLILHPASSLVRSAIADLGAPFVVLDAPPEAGCCCIGRDEQATAEQGVARMVELGHRSIAMVHLDDILGRPPRPIHPRAELRQQGYRQAMQSAGLAIPSLPPPCGGLSKWVHALCRMQSRPTALLAYDSFDAERVVRELRAHGVNVPDDVSMLALHRSSGLGQWSDFDTPITSFELQHPEMGELAARRLLAYIDNPEHVPDSVVLPPVLGEGATLAPAP